MDGGGWLRGRRLGRGSTASVYLATATAGREGGSAFAVKSTELSRSEPLRREREMLSSIRHPHVVSCLGSDVSAEPDGRVLFNLFMEYAPGGTLADAIRARGVLDERTIRLYTRGILDGLAYLHGRGIAHCDVKGHNILLLGDGGTTAKLADFGCARWVDGPEDRGSMSGTPLYMAPEVARGEEQGPAGDIWALGCTVIEMASGRPPWRDMTDPVAAVHRIAFSAETPEIPCDVVSDDAADFMRRCLSRDPRKRWSAAELLDHPFAADCGEESRRPSPKSTLDRVFWDSWAEEAAEVAEEREAAAEARSAYPAPAGSVRDRLRRLAGDRASPSTAADTTWDGNCWIAVRNGTPPVCPASGSPPGEMCVPRTAGDEPPTGARVSVEAAAAESSAGFGCCQLEGYHPSSLSIHR